MTSVVELLGELERRGISIRAEGEALKLKPAGGLDKILIERVKALKPEILAAHRTRPATYAASCKHCDGKGECVARLAPCGELKRLCRA